jgi:hypothetical protein
MYLLEIYAIESVESVESVESTLFRWPWKRGPGKVARPGGWPDRVAKTLTS